MTTYPVENYRISNVRKNTLHGDEMVMLFDARVFVPACGERPARLGCFKAPCGTSRKNLIKLIDDDHRIAY